MSPRHQALDGGPGVVIRRVKKAGHAESEGDVSDAIRVRLSEEPDCLVLRNSVGMFDVLRGGDVHKVRAGAGGRGASDLLVCLAGRFIALEVKRAGEIPSAAVIDKVQARYRAGETLSKHQSRIVEQSMFLDMVRMHGGFGAYVDSVEAAVAAIGRARRGEDR